MRSILYPGLGILLLAGCEQQGEHQYPDDVRNNYIQAWVSRGQAETACECTLAGLEDRLSYNEFKELDDAIRADDKQAQTRLQNMMQTVQRNCGIGS